MENYYHQDFAQFKPDINAPAYQDNHYNQGFAHYNADANVAAYQPRGIYGGQENAPVFNGFPDAPAYQPHGIYGQQEHLPANNGFPIAQNPPHGIYGGQENVPVFNGFPDAQNQPHGIYGGQEAAYSQNTMASNFPPMVPAYQNGIPCYNGNYQLGIYDHQQHQFGIGNQENVPPTNLVQQEVATRRGKLCEYGDLAHIFEYEKRTTGQVRIFNITKNEYPNGVLMDIGLVDKAHWLKYYEHTNEMMLVNHGRNLFPQLGFRFARMHPNVDYVLGIKLQLQSDDKFEYDGEKWYTVKTEQKVAKQSNELFSVPKKGSELMAKGFMFKNMKIYNIGNDNRKGRNSKEGLSEDQLEKIRKAEEQKARNMLLVVPQHMYVPKLSVYAVSPFGEMSVVQTDVFNEASFIACTAYKNDVIRKLKSADNKFTPSTNKTKMEKTNRPLKSISNNATNHQGPSTSHSSPPESVYSSPSTSSFNWSTSTISPANSTTSPLNTSSDVSVHSPPFARPSAEEMGYWSNAQLAQYSENYMLPRMHF